MEKLKLKRHSAGLFTPGPAEREEATRGYGVVFWRLRLEAGSGWTKRKVKIGNQPKGLWAVRGTASERKSAWVQAFSYSVPEGPASP